ACCSDAASEWNVAVLLGRIAIAFRAQRFERIDQARTRIARIDDVVHVAAAGGDVRMRELLAILVDLLVGRILRIAPAAISRRNRISTAPVGPMTAISAVG